MTQQARESSDRLIRFVAELHFQQFLDVADGHAATHHEAAIRFTHHIRRRRLSIDSAFADNLFHQVFHGRDARHRSMLVDNHRQRLPLLPHFAQQLRTNFGLRDEEHGFDQFTHLALQQILIRDLQQVLRVYDAENIVERFLVYRDLVQIRRDNFRVQIFERGVRRHGHNVGPRRHHFAHAFVAEFDDLLDQVRLFRLDDAFFFRYFHQRFNSLFRALLFGLLGLLLRNPRERFRAFQEYAHRPDEPHRPANQRQQRPQPSPGGAVEQHVRNKMHRKDHFEHDENSDFHQGFPDAPDEIHDPARRLQHQESQPEMAEDAKRAAAALAFDFQLRFDFRFKNFQMFVDAARGHACELPLDLRRVGENRQG